MGCRMPLIRLKTKGPAAGMYPPLQAWKQKGPTLKGGSLIGNCGALRENESHVPCQLATLIGQSTQEGDDGLGLFG